jgi:hypothetical protein
MMKKYFVVFTSLSISHPWNQPILSILYCCSSSTLKFAPQFYFTLQQLSYLDFAIMKVEEVGEASFP